VAYSEEGEVFKQHTAMVRNKYSNYEMILQSNIKTQVITNEKDVPFIAKRPKIDYEDGIIRMRLGKTYLSNKSLEYPFDSKNNLLFLFGHYLETKTMEASLIKDTLVLSNNIEEPTVYYLDMNRNTSLKRAKTIIKEMRDKWVLSGKMVYAASDEVEDVLSDIKDLIRTREDDEDSELYPILVVLARAENAFEDEDMCDEICELINSGKISGKQGKEVLEKSLETGKEPGKLVSEMGLSQITDETEIRNIVLEVIQENINLVDDYKAGKRVFDFFIGQIMKKTRGRANPVITSKILKEELEK
jgi:hypothetical protein